MMQASFLHQLSALKIDLSDVIEMFNLI